MRGFIFFVFLTIFIEFNVQDANCQEFDLSIVHINDFHAKYEPVSESTAVCQPGENEQGLCYGGIARIATALNQYKESLPNSVLINGGDNYQGSLLYSLFKWNITVDFMNRLPIDATAIGNHEFDDGIEGVVDYMEKLKSPLLAVNIDASKEPTIQGKYLPSIVIKKGERKIGIIGSIAKDTNFLSSTEDLIFLDEVISVTAEAAKLRSEEVDIIILVSHSGYDVDQQIALQVPDLDVIVGSHSHTFLYTGTPPSTEMPAGEYPTVVTQTNGHRVLIVQASAYTKYVGVLSLKFDSAGEVTSWSGNPVLLDSTIVEDPDILKALEPWVEEANILGNTQLGTTLVLLDNTGCYSGECNIGNFFTDAMVIEQMAKTTDAGYWSKTAIGLINPGGIRASIGESSSITYNDLITSQPFANSIDTIELQGKDLKELLEDAAGRTKVGMRAGPYCFQVSGMQLVYNMTEPEGSRVVEMMIRCAKCRVPTFYPMKPDDWYSVAMPSFLSKGGDNFLIIPNKGRNKIVGDIDIDIISRYIARESPIVLGKERRISYIY